MTDRDTPISPFAGLKQHESWEPGDPFRYIDRDGVSHPSKVSILGDILGFCGCGNPDMNALFILRGLESIDARRAICREGGAGWFEKIEQAEAALFGNEHSARFFHYWADEKCLTDHGGSIPGWLSERGKSVVAALKEAIQEARESGELEDETL